MQNLTEERTGQLIRELRLKAGWTQKELGMKIGISDKAISKWERGLSFPDITLSVSYTHLDVYKRQIRRWPIY